MAGKNGLGDLFAVVLGASKDKVYMETAEKLQAAFHELILAEADSRRQKTATIVRAMAKIDIETFQFKKAYRQIAGQLDSETILAIDSYLKRIEQIKKDLVYEKNAIKLRR